MRHFSIQALLTGCTPAKPFNASALLSTEALADLTRGAFKPHKLATDNLLVVPDWDADGRVNSQRLFMALPGADLRLQTFADKSAELSLQVTQNNGLLMTQSRQAVVDLVNALGYSSLRIGEERQKEALSPLQFVWGAMTSGRTTYRNGGNMEVGGSVVALAAKGRQPMKNIKPPHAGNALALRTR